MGLQANEIPSKAKMVQNIIEVFNSATQFDYDNGRTWYARTQEYCRLYADMFGYPLENVVAAYAVISPSLDKEQNDKQIVKAIIAHKTGIIPMTDVRLGVYGRRNREKAQRCLDGDLSAIGGKKVTSFFNNIMGYGSSEVTVDRWAVRVALNSLTLSEEKIVPGSKGVYDSIKDAYLEAAAQLNVLPSIAQSVTWEVWRNQFYKMSKDNWK
jgi:hypothetical protein